MEPFIHRNVLLTSNVFFTLTYKGLEHDTAHQRLKDLRRPMYMLFVRLQDNYGMIILLTNYDVEQISKSIIGGSAMKPELCHQFLESKQVLLLNALGNVVCSCGKDVPTNFEEIISSDDDKELFVQAFFASGFINQISTSNTLSRAYELWDRPKKLAFMRFYLEYRVPEYARKSAEQSRMVKELITFSNK